jgi:hypothetical protein
MILRIARHTNNIVEVTAFYTEVIGLQVIGSFANHNDYDGVFFGKENLNWHIEFTRSSDRANQRIDEDDLIVFYPESESEYNGIIEKIKALQIPIQKAKNPYWNQNGIVLKDPDGFGVVISPLKLKTTGAKSE